MNVYLKVPSSLNRISPSVSNVISSPASKVRSLLSDIVELLIVISSTVNVVNVPSDVMFVCAAVANVPTIEFAVTVPLALMLPEAVIWGVDPDISKLLSTITSWPVAAFKLINDPAPPELSKPSVIPCPLDASDDILLALIAFIFSILVEPSPTNAILPGVGANIPTGVLGSRPGKSDTILIPLLPVNCILPDIAIKSPPLLSPNIVLPFMLRLSAVTVPLALMLPEAVIFEVILPPIFKSVPINTFLAILAPPSTRNTPVSPEAFVASIVEVISRWAEFKTTLLFSSSINNWVPLPDDSLSPKVKIESASSIELL